MAHAQLLTTTSNESASTSGSNMLMTLRKDRGTPPDILDGSRSRETGDGSTPSDGFTRLPITHSDYVESVVGPNDEPGPNVSTGENDAVGRILGKVNLRADAGFEDERLRSQTFTLVARSDIVLTGGKFEDYVETSSGFKPSAAPPKQKPTETQKPGFLAVPDDPFRPSAPTPSKLKDLPLPSAPTPSKLKDLPIADPRTVSIAVTKPQPQPEPEPEPEQAPMSQPDSASSTIQTELLQKMYSRLGDIDDKLVSAVVRQLNPVTENGLTLSPVQLGELYNKLMNSPELTMMVKLGLIKWSDLVKPGARELNFEYIAKIQQSLEQFSQQREADNLRNIQFRKRQQLTAGQKPSRGGPFGPNVTMYQPAHYPPP